jgi:hypothetical protein
MRRGRHLLSVGLLALLAFTLIGHICALPHGDDHAGAPQENAAHDHDGGDALHVASCAGVRPAPSPSPWAPQASAPIKVEVVTAPTARVFLARRPQPSSSPPLFLLHASLLI